MTDAEVGLDAGQGDESWDDESWDDEDHPTAGRAGDVLAYLASQLVEDPHGVRIETSPARSGVKLSLRVAPGDMGKVIGRRGRIAQSIRGVVRAAGASDGLDVLVDIVD